MPRLVRLPTQGINNRQQDMVAKVVRELQPNGNHVASSDAAALPGGTSPFAGGNRISVALTASTAKPVAHNLGKNWTGYTLIGNDVHGTVTGTRGSTDDSKYITLEASATGNYTLVVF